MPNVLKQKKVIRSGILCLLILALSAFANALDSQQEDSYSALLERINQNTALSDDKRSQLKETLAKAKEEMNARRDWQNQQTALQVLLAQSGKQIKKFSNRTSMLDTARKKIRSFSLEKLNKLRNDNFNEIEDLKTQKTEQEGRLSEYLSLTQDGHKTVVELEKQIAGLQPPEAISSPQNSTSLDAIISDYYQTAKRLSAQAKLAKLKTELDNISELIALAQAHRDYLDFKITDLQSVNEYIQGVMLAKNAQSSLKEYLEPNINKNSDKHSLLLERLQQANDLLTEDYQKQVVKNLFVEQQIISIRNELESIQSRYKQIKRVVEVAGNTEKASQLLLKHKKQLLNIRSKSRQSATDKKDISSSLLRQLELDEKIQSVDTIEKYIALVGLEQNPKEVQDAKSRRDVKSLYKNYRSGLQKLNKLVSQYSSSLSERDATSNELESNVASYWRYINSKLLWLPSAGPIPLSNHILLVQGLEWFLNPAQYDLFVFDLANWMSGHKIVVFFWLILMGAVLTLGHKVKQRFSELADKVKKPRLDRYSLTVEALAYTLILIAPVALVNALFSMIVRSQELVSDFTQGIMTGLNYSTGMLLILTIVRQLYRHDGLEEAHFKWNKELCRQIVLHTRLIRWSLIPAVFFVGVSLSEQSEPLIAVGRIAFVIAMIILNIWIFRLFRKKNLFSHASGSVVIQERWQIYHSVWYPLIFVLPGVLIVAALFGYYYTACYLAEKLVYSYLFLLPLVLTRQMLLRRLFVTKRTLRYEEALKRLEQAMSTDHNDKSADTKSSELDELCEEEMMSMITISDQVTQLVRVTFLVAALSILWLVWRDTIPAFNVFNSVELPFLKSQLIEGKTVEQAVTLGDLFVAVIVALLSLLAAKNLPGLLEITFLQRLPFSASTRYAITTLTQYVVAMIGIVFTFSAIGLEWSNIQWLVAALSVGLGFGLQEIVANFVSGIILLFEQPLRVGDVVTVNNVSGKVARIRIRATTIINWDRQEFIIPNKNIITGELTNWTLSDKLNRVIITVGIAYGSDAGTAMKLIQEAAIEHPKVLDDPEPLVSFEEFGDNALILRLRAYMSEVDIRVSTTTELHQGIYNKLNEAGVVFAFPQRDIHLDTNKPLEFVMREMGEGTP